MDSICFFITNGLTAPSNERRNMNEVGDRSLNILDNSCSEIDEFYFFQYIKLLCCTTFKSVWCKPIVKVINNYSSYLVKVLWTRSSNTSRYGFFVLQIVPKQMNALVTDEFDPWNKTGEIRLNLK